VVSRCDVLAVGAHPDDVELGCGATVARLVARGRAVGVLDLTAGELGTRGDARTREREARAAAAALAVAWRHCLGMPDGGLDGGDDGQIGIVVGALRGARPRVVLLPDERDPHPDHAAAAVLVRRAAFLAGVGKYRPEAGGAFRPRLLLAYPGPRQSPEPALVVDVSLAYSGKRVALAAHASQFDPSAGGERTHLASGYYLAAVEGRDRVAGSSIGVEFGEAFSTVGPVAADEVAWLFGGGSESCESSDPWRGKDKEGS
jgi:bacillithiol biosynthesis deacetylase BshB1